MGDVIVLPGKVLASHGDGPQDPGMEARVAVLEEIAASTKEVLKDIRTDLKGVREKQESDFRILVGLGFSAAAALAIAMAKGFHWF